MGTYKTSSREVHGEHEITVSLSDEVVAKFYGGKARANFICWADGRRQWATRAGEPFSIYDENSQQYTHGTIDQLLGLMHDPRWVHQPTQSGQADTN